MKKTSATASKSTRKIRPALSPEARENQLISLAMDRAEQQLLDGTASSQVITHFLKLGTAKYQYESEKLKNETALVSAKTEALESAKRVEELYAEALKAMKTYSGRQEIDDEDIY